MPCFLSTFRPVRTLASACATIIALTATSAQAQNDYPARPISMVVPFTPGGGTDGVARILGDQLGKQLKQSIVIDNRAGAAGVIGTASVAKASPDGYRILFTSSAPITIASNMPDSTLNYDPVQDLAPVALVARQPVLVVVNAKSPAKSLEDLVALSKSTPDGLTYGSPGAGTELHMTGELFRQSTDANLLHVPYKGGAPAITDLLAGHIDVLFVVTSSILPHIQSGAVRALATTDTQRIPVLPDVPTTAEAGLPAVNATAWWGVFAPKDTPEEVIQRLTASIKTVEQDATFQARMAEAGVMPDYLDPAAFADHIENELGKWKQVVEATADKMDN